MKIAISSGHGLKVRGASHPDGLDEVDEARRVVPEIANWLKLRGHEVVEFHDDVSTNQSDNLNWIVSHHNSVGPHDYDVSVHFNAYTWTDGGRGTECLWVTQQGLAEEISRAISEASGLINRGAPKRSDLYFLNGCREPSVLIEVAFVDAAADVELYQKRFESICEAIANAIAPIDGDEIPIIERPLHMRGKVSWFGGPDDIGVSPSEGLAFLYDVDDKPHIFLDDQPEGTTGLARRLDADGSNYLAMRWDYAVFPKDRLAGDEVALIRNPKNGKHVLAHPADWGPHVDTNRVADVSPKVMAELGLETDDEVEVIYPHHAQKKHSK
jgi:N-acetylmuramoyl-L-alanine amidase